MALPVLSSPEFITEIPSTKEKIKFRPFLVREEKILYMALEGGDPKEIQNATIKVLNDCILTPNVDASKLATFDVEYLFLQLRGKSVGENVDVVLRHTDSDCKETVNVSISLDDIKVVGEISDGKLMLTDNVGIKMKYPMAGDINKFQIEEGMNVFNSIAHMVDYIYDKETVYNDYSREEIAEWLEQLNQKQFTLITEFMNNMPKLSHTVEWTCNVCGEKETIVLEGLQSFFT
tara:strand:+ start:1171 stop:1869 length:699 start_codon:yes stop_codon:yes gene_type:complete